MTGIAVGSLTVVYILFCGLPEAPPTYRRAGQADRLCSKTMQEGL